MSDEDAEAAILLLCPWLVEAVLCRIHDCDSSGEEARDDNEEGGEAIVV